MINKELNKYANKLVNAFLKKKLFHQYLLNILKNY